MRWLKALTILSSVAVALCLLIAAELYGLADRKDRTVTTYVGSVGRDQVNAAVCRLIMAGRATELYSFYAQEVGDPTRAMLYTSSALIQGAPVDLVIAIGWYEGGHQIGIVDGPNRDGSYDVRPMALNTFTYQTYTVEELKQVEFNIAAGVGHLAGDRAKWQVSWEAALASYNKGSPRGLDQAQVDYVAAVLRHEWGLDRRFAERFPDMF